MTWGVVSTIKASLVDTLNFVAHHAELGAHRLYIYLDDPDDASYAALKAHPKVRVTLCDDGYWSKQKRRPKKHQVRQSANASHAYGRAEVDWLVHIDVDEFLWTEAPVHQHLTNLPEDCQCARLYPAESLADGDGSAFKAIPREWPQRLKVVERLYPTYGKFLNGGFLSHVEGKLFLRTGLPDITFRIHNVFQGDGKNPGERALTDITLCHRHANSWDQFIGKYAFRLERGSYRSELTPMRPLTSGGMTLHQLLSSIEQRDGTEGLRDFYQELFADTPEHREKLHAEGLLRICDLMLDKSRAKHFPNHA